MFSGASLLALLAFSITGSPVEVRNSSMTLPMTRRPIFTNVTDMVRHDEARVVGFREYSTHGRRDNIFPVLNMKFGYFIPAIIGSPPKTYHLIVDSSSSITWVGASTLYASSSGVDTKQPVAVDYTFGSFQGTIFNDRFSLGARFTIHTMLIGVASTSWGIGFDGVFGIGPTESSRGALKKSPEETIPSVIDYLFRQRTITAPVVGIFFQPVVENTNHYGEITIGGVDLHRYSGKIEFTDITTTPLSSHYWGINGRIAYGNTDLTPYTAGVVDCGSTFLYIASDAYQKYQTATGGVKAANSLLQISTHQYYNLSPLKFHIGSQVYSLSPNAQIWPRSINYVINANANDIFLVVRSLSTPSGTGVDFIIGYVFLQRFYTVFDAEKSRVGFAQTQFTNAFDN
ncbi:aspartic peptidase A1 [Suillus spraguei]|nr:aspartic peptidase A1 [Suillus spraguei]